MHALPTRRGKGAAGAHFHINFVNTLAYRHKHFDNVPQNFDPAAFARA